MTQAALMPHPWRATQHRAFIEKVVLEDQANGVDGRSWDAQIRRDPESTGDPLASFAIEVVDDDPDESGNLVFYFKLTPDQTALLPPISHWDVRITYSDDAGPDPFLKGVIETEQAVTRTETP